MVQKLPRHTEVPQIKSSDDHVHISVQLHRHAVAQPHVEIQQVTFTDKIAHSFADKTMEQGETVMHQAVHLQMQIVQVQTARSWSSTMALPGTPIL